MAVSPSGALVATSTAFRRIELWRNLGDRLARAGEVHLAAGADNQRAEDLTFGPDDRTLFAGLRSRTVDVFDVGEETVTVVQMEKSGFADRVGGCRRAGVDHDCNRSAEHDCSRSDGDELVHRVLLGG